MSIRFIKVKIKSLAEEARIIRHEERCTSGTLRDQLHGHRVVTVRRAARAALLAYGYLRGRTVAQVDSALAAHYGQPQYSMPQFGIVAEALKLVHRYGLERVRNAGLTPKTEPFTTGTLAAHWDAWLKGGACLSRDSGGISTPRSQGFDSPQALQSEKAGLVAA